MEKHRKGEVSEVKWGDEQGLCIPILLGMPSSLQTRMLFPLGAGRVPFVKVFYD